ncbi:MAG: Fe-S cluster assembly protein HesB [Phycisphaerales bacterium]|nr:Fe-S cluster assembly protein HesB [Phycisphaerales bacterium]
MPTRTLSIPVAPPFDLQLALHGHGWVHLAPHAYDEATGALRTVLRHGQRAIDAELTQTAPSRLRLRLVSHRPLAEAAAAALRSQVRHMLRLDDDLSAFHARCAQEPRLRWVAQRGAGRLLRSASVFEDLMKLLFTTNTTWSGTEAMTQNLVAAAGPVAPSGARAFPSPQQCRRDAAFYRDVVRAGYRAASAMALADDFATGALTDAQFHAPQSSDELWRRLTALRGFGPYAAGQALRLLGHFDRLALDSWCRAKLKERDGRRTPPSDAAIARRYAPFAPWQGLALWMDLTADWHGDGA